MKLANLLACRQNFTTAAVAASPADTVAEAASAAAENALWLAASGWDQSDGADLFRLCIVPCMERSGARRHSLLAAVDARDVEMEVADVEPDAPRVALGV